MSWITLKRSGRVYLHLALETHIEAISKRWQTETLQEKLQDQPKIHWGILTWEQFLLLKKSVFNIWKGWTIRWLYRTCSTYITDPKTPIVLEENGFTFGMFSAYWGIWRWFLLDILLNLLVRVPTCDIVPKTDMNETDQQYVWNKFCMVTWLFTPLICWIRMVSLMFKQWS